MIYWPCVRRMECFCVGSDFVDVRTVNRHGRCAIAVSSASEGQILSSSRALNWSLRSDFVESLCSNCMRQSESLKSCVRCKHARYCSKECQTSDWKQHKHECPHIATLSSKLSSADFDEALLLIRYVFSTKARPSSSDCHVKDGTIHCCSSHVESFHKPSVRYDEGLLGILSLLCAITKQPMDAIATLLFQFRSNNFGILNDLLTCIGAGVFPHAAVLNHSCAPNCLLRYECTPGGPLLHIVALRDIAAGEELCHSYVDCASPRVARLLSCQKTYDFTCDCNMCHLSTAALKTTGKIAASSGELGQQLRDKACWSDPWLLKQFLDQATHHQPVNPEPYQTEVAVAEPEYRKASQRANELSEQALDLDLNSEDPTAAAAGLALLEQAVTVLEAAVGPFNFELYTLRGRLLTQYLLSGQLDRALAVGLRVVGYLVMSLHHLPRHPLLGLQLFTLGDIAAELGQLPLSLRLYEWSRDVLRVSHGGASAMVVRLEENIGLVHAGMIDSNIQR